MIEFLESVGNCLIIVASHDDYFNVYFYISQADFAKVVKSIKYVLPRPLIFLRLLQKNVHCLTVLAAAECFPDRSRSESVSPFRLHDVLQTGGGVGISRVGIRVGQDFKEILVADEL